VNFGVNVRAQQACPNRWIGGGGGTINWPARSPDIAHFRVIDGILLHEALIVNPKHSVLLKKEC
jgi:hypothetical protein